MMTPAPSLQWFCPRCGTPGANGPCSRDGTARVEIVAGSLLGTQVGNYVVVKLLGEGGMGSVYRAVQPEIGAEVAIKVLHATSQSQAEAVQRFLLEAQAVNRVRHANLISILDTGYLADRRPYLVMELLDGMSVSDSVGKLGPALAVHVACEALDALEAVHDNGVVHRDLKPANLFIERDGRVVVLDFGIAKLVDADGVAQTHSTGMIGTPEYMAPEQIRSRPLDRRTDVYAMGIVLYETITGRRPFAAVATFDMLVQHLERPPTSPRERVPELAPAISDAILRALEKDPAQRFQTAAEMAAALRAANDPEIGRSELSAFVTVRVPTLERAKLVNPSPQPDAAPPTTPLRARGSAPEPPPSDPTRAGHGSARGSERGRAPQLTLPTVDDRPPLPRKRPRWMVPVILGAGLAAFGGTLTYLELAKHGNAASEAVVPAVPVVPHVTTPPADATTVAVVDAQLDEVARLQVATEPPGARIWVDGVMRLDAPGTLDLHPGPHRLRLELEGYTTVDEQLTLVIGEPQTISRRLTKKRHVTATVPVTHGAPDPTPQPEHKPDVITPLQPATGSGTVPKPNPYR